MCQQEFKLCIRKLVRVLLCNRNLHCTRVLAMSYPVKETETVFLEDIDTNYKIAEDDEQSAPQSSQPGHSQEQKKASNKRQRTIDDMFFGPKKQLELPKKQNYPTLMAFLRAPRSLSQLRNLLDCRSSMPYPFHCPNSEIP